MYSYSTRGVLVLLVLVPIVILVIVVLLVLVRVHRLRRTPLRTRLRRTPLHRVSRRSARNGLRWRAAGRVSGTNHDVIQGTRDMGLGEVRVGSR
jgi:hypothetical protein